MDFKTINYEKKGTTALITLNRPEKLNAWTPFMAEELAESINDANEDKSVGAIVMTGAERVFVLEQILKILSKHELMAKIQVKTHNLEVEVCQKM